MVEELKVGDRVKVIKKASGDCAGGNSHFCCEKYIGRIGTVTVYEGDEGSIGVKNFPDTSAWCSAFSRDCLEKVDSKIDVGDSNPITKGGHEMREVIANVFEKTKDAVLVEKWLGCEFNDNFISGLIVETYKTEILKEAKRREEESKESARFATTEK